jgi:hypothetical protein
MPGKTPRNFHPIRRKDEDEQLPMTFRPYFQNRLGERWTPSVVTASSFRSRSGDFRSKEVAQIQVVFMGEI